jgi:ribosome-binding factor A
MVREALSEQFQRNPPDFLDGLVTVVSVKMSPDLRVAKVYVSIYRSTSDPDLIIKRLNARMPEIRKRLNSQVHLRYSPELRFYRDDTLDTAERIDELLRSVRADKSSSEGDDTPTSETDSNPSE